MCRQRPRPRRHQEHAAGPYLTAPSCRFVFAGASLAGRLVGWAAQTLRTTVSIVRKPADQKRFAVLPRRWAVERTLAWLTPRSAAVEFEARVPPGGTVTIVSARQAVTVKQGLAGRTLTIWADLHSVHLILDGYVLPTVASRLLSQDLAFLAMRGARKAGPEPAQAALQHRNGKPLPGAGQAVEIDRKVHRDGHVTFDGEKYQVGTGEAAPPSPCAWTGTSCTPSPMVRWPGPGPAP